jgi:hypothetical protein
MGDSFYDMFLKIEEDSTAALSSYFEKKWTGVYE